MVKRRNQSRVLRKQHTISKYVAGHIAYTNSSKICGLTINTNFTEMTFNRFPATACCNSHFLMVITNTTARCECVTKPETEFFGNAISNIRERSRSFICCYNQVRVIIVKTHNVFWRYYFAINDIVGNI